MPFVGKEVALSDTCRHVQRWKDFLCIKRFVIQCSPVPEQRMENSQEKASTYPCIGEGAECESYKVGKEQWTCRTMWLKNGAWVGGLGSSFWKGELEVIFEGLTPYAKEFEVYYLGNKDVIKDF